MARVEEGRQCRGREVVASSEQPNSEGGAAADVYVTTAIRQLPSYLQLMVTLMANMVFPHEESKMREKRGNDTFEQVASMMMAVSITYSLDKIFLSVACSYSFFISLFI